jgi:cytochrome c553
MAGIVTAMAAVIGGTGFALATATAEPGQAASPSAVTAQTGNAARSGCASCHVADHRRRRPAARLGR